ncbi:MAG TPA: cobalamin-dependent protein [Candidatus Eisenbacteria bacterium]|nr:cobalamin-dependent protein [Candidatus Eisenbacteria bacterium]
MSASKVHRRAEPGWLTIGTLARATGIPPSTLRTWERRYRVPVPSRKPSGHRLYPVETVRHLRALRRALDLGRTPAEVMRLPLSELEELLGEARRPGERPRAGERRGRREGAAPTTLAGGAPLIASLLAAARSLDRRSLRRALVDAWAGLGPIECLGGVVAPFLHEIGAAWAEGTLSVRHEHFASGVVADFLREARRPFEERAEGPVAVAATLPGDLHEIGLLSVALLLSMSGWRVAYLGPDTPVREIAAFAKDAGARAVAVSVSPSRRRGAASAIRALRAALPRGVELWLGGEGAPPDLPGSTRFENLSQLASRLEV